MPNKNRKAHARFSKKRFFELMITPIKPRSDSLAASLTRLGLLDDFFALVATKAPSYDEMRAWLSERGISSSVGAIYNLVTYHMGAWSAACAIKAADETAAKLPDGCDEILKQRISGMKLDLVLHNLTSQQQLAVWKLDQAERDLALRNMSMRDAAVDELLKEADGNEEAKEKLNEFLAALDRAKEASHDKA